RARTSRTRSPPPRSASSCKRAGGDRSRGADPGDVIRLPERIVCLSTESVEVLYALGEEARIAGISGYTVRPPQARREKPKVSGFSTAHIERILAVRPDLVLAFSDLQADICRDLVRAGIEVH